MTSPMKEYILKTYFFIVLFILGSLTLLADQPTKIGKMLNEKLPFITTDYQVLVVVYFTDKGNVTKYKGVQAQAFVSERSLNRRLKVRDVSSVIDEYDYPLELSYVRAVEQNVVQLRHQLKWFNAVSAVATKQQIETLCLLPFVREIELVGRWKTDRSREEAVEEPDVQLKHMPAAPPPLDYGASYRQLAQINVPAVHEMGIYGQGVVIGVFDNGFRLLTHEAFASMRIIATYDFVDKKVSVVPYNPAHGGHGVNTLSTIGGYKPGQLIGPAFKADYILARTENDSSETPIEEDNWAKAIEWADSIGVDVTSTSLGYLTYDPPYPSWTWQDMDGNTTLITRAADRAAQLGIVVVNSAGNYGYNASRNTLGAPADGDSVIAAGAVDSLGNRASFSSVGPTTDGRIKPDVMAMGVAVRVASSSNPSGYARANGTSFSCPLSAGVAALVLCAKPSLTPMQVREAMRQTASNAASPNNLIGWGILNALAAINYFGVDSFAHVSGTVYEDINGDGIRNYGEPGVSGVKVRIAGTRIDSTTTNELGNYTFSGVQVGNHSISLDLPYGWIQTYPEATQAVSVDSTLSNITGKNFGIFGLGSISGTVFDDVNRNGVKDAVDIPLQGWKVFLNGRTSDSTLTDAEGNYKFTNLVAGTYLVKMSTPPFWIRSYPLNDSIYTFQIISKSNETNADFGYYNKLTIAFAVREGWNLLSLPLEVDTFAVAGLYPTASSRAFIFDRGYVSVDTVRRGLGYWLKFSSPQSVYITGKVVLHDTIDVKRGWNLIGSLSLPVQKTDIVQIPDGIVLTDYIGYGEGCYYSCPYQPTLSPHTAYWVKVRTDGKLVLTASSSKNNWSKVSESK